MKKMMLFLVLSLAPITALLVSCGSTPTSSSSGTPTPVYTATSTPTPSFKTLVSFGSAAVSLDGLCVDSSDNVYAADFFTANTNSYLLKVTSAGVTSQVKQIDNITSVAYDGTNWYAGAGNSSYFYYYNGSTVNQALGSGSSNWGTAINSSATTLAIGTGSAVSFFYNFPTFTSGSNISPLPATPNGPEALAFDNNGNLYVALPTVIIKYAAGTTSSPTTIAGLGGAGYVDGAGPTVAKFNDLTAIAVDKNDNVYVADDGNAGVGISIREVSGGNVQTLVGPTGASVTPLLTSLTLTQPEGIAVDGSGNVFFSDRSNPNGAIYEYIP